MSMWTQAVDLHSHSTHSDGQHDVPTVAETMANRGVKVWALTDHDTINGWEEGANAAARLGLRFVPGIEITCEVAEPSHEEELMRHGQERPSNSWHLLAYFPTWKPGATNEKINAFQRWLLPHQSGRTPRMVAMCERLGELGMPVDAERVMARATGSVGRPHLAEEMVSLGYVATKQEAFETWIGDGLPGFVEHRKPNLEQAVQQIHKAGGVASLAHPKYYGVPVSRLLEVLNNSGVDAVEAVHRSHSDAYRYELMLAATANGLGITVGSDFHGLDYGQLPGHMPAIIERLLPAVRP